MGMVDSSVVVATVRLIRPSIHHVAGVMPPLNLKSALQRWPPSPTPLPRRSDLLPQRSMFGVYFGHLGLLSPKVIRFR